MSVFGLERNQTSPGNAYDHAINLVDSTKPGGEVEGSLDEPSGSGTLSRSGSGTFLNRQWTKGTLRKELARRKYAKWQEDKTPETPATEADGDDGDEETSSSSQAKPTRQGTARSGRLRDRIPFWTKKRAAKATKDTDTFIDVLYENQRGFFFFGIPFYSSNSLLNLDPSGWQTSTFQDSGVNITNAQLPDPSWEWAWRTWYADMSYDVDEDGWQYSFSFGSGFVWHGNHPWLHSFVRRRRWLRKRVKVHRRSTQNRKSDMKDAHMLTADYFTIHAGRRDRSRGSSTDRNTMNRSSIFGSYAYESESDSDLGEIPDIAALMAAMKRALIDREKLAAVRAFLDQGGDELFYLADTTPAIMGDFIHQTSRRQVQTQLLRALDKATRDREGKPDDQEEEDAAKRRVDNLLKAINSAGVHVNDQDYWSDLRKRTAKGESKAMDETHDLDATESAHLSGEKMPAHIGDDEEDVREEIKGIPASAAIFEEPRIRFDISRVDTVDHDATGKLDKGKAKEKA